MALRSTELQEMIVGHSRDFGVLNWAVPQFFGVQSCSLCKSVQASNQVTLQNAEAREQRFRPPLKVRIASMRGATNTAD
jgi:hypothetical protein